mmetsp:Transcript_115413/g.337488  ORF Transcript_115413/g.337488 Transcript_115413/m.337488 type:complete len:346 (+) Transcript_115413:90-1127(+)
MSPDLPPSSVAVVDLAPYTNGEGDAEARQAAAQAFDAACRGSGFVAAKLPLGGVTAELAARAFAAAKELFGLPEEAKLGGLRRLTSETNCGYSPLASEALDRARGPDSKEAFNVRKRGVHRNDYSGCPEGFRAVAEELWDALEAAARRMAECAAAALGLGDEAFFARALRRWDQTTLRFLHYPPCDWRGGEPPVRCGAHTDFGMLTVLLVLEGEEGLQIKRVEGASVSDAEAGGAGWRTAELPRDTSRAVVNTGALLARWTNDVYRATAHRVVVPTAEAAQRHRYSIAFFVDPDADAVVSAHPSLVPKGERPKYPPVSGREYLLGKLREAHDGGREDAKRRRREE